MKWSMWVARWVTPKGAIMNRYISHDGEQVMKWDQTFILRNVYMDFLQLNPGTKQGSDLTS